MSRNSGSAYPRPDDDITRIKADDAAYYERNDDLWDDPDNARAFPTRPSDDELRPSRRDGHLTLEELAEWQDEEEAARKGRRAWKARAR